jgi:hypothetical protein
MKFRDYLMWENVLGLGKHGRNYEIIEDLYVGKYFVELFFSGKMVNKTGEICRIIRVGLAFLLININFAMKIPTKFRRKLMNYE